MNDEERKIKTAKNAISICRFKKSCETCLDSLKTIDKEPCKMFGELYEESMWNYRDTPNE